MSQITKINFKELKTIIGTVNTTNDYMVINHDSHGLISSRIMDPSHVSLIDIRYQSNIPNKQYQLQIDHIWPTIRKIKTKQTDIEIKIDDYITTWNDNIKAIHDCIDIVSDEYEMPPLPKIEFEFTGEVNLKDFQYNCKLLETKKYNGVMIGNGKVKSDLVDNMIEIDMPELDTDQIGYYSLEYITPFLANQYWADKNTKLGISYSTNKPLKLSVENDRLNIDYYVAPRVEN